MTEAKIEKISPTKAKKILKESNVGNRNVRQRIVEQYRKDMENDDWELNGSAITFDDNGILLDGQHRLLACIEAKKSFKTLVVSGVRSESRDTMDTGAKRSTSDVLHFHGYTSTAQLGATISFLIRYMDNQLTYNEAISHRRVLNFVKENPQVTQSVSAVLGKSTFGGTKTILSAIHFLARENLEGEFAAFHEQIKTGENLQEGHPVLALRTWLINDQIMSRKAPATLRNAIVVKAWNAFIEGTEVARLSYRPGGLKKEKFPEILTDYPS